MTKEIIEGNRIIGVFDGWFQKELPKNGDLNWFHEKYSTKITDTQSVPTKPEYFKYHSSWDWLMPVVEKIESIAPSRVVIDCREVRIVKPKGSDVKVHSDSKILSVWQACIQFIQWYNENKKQ